MLVTLQDVLKQAQTKKYAVGAFNITNPLCLSPIIKAAENQRSPVIINIAEVSFIDTDLDRFYPAIVHAAKESFVPVVINLDHGTSEEGVFKAIQYGFSSVMFDASSYNYETNLRKTAQCAKVCHSLGLSLEGELGVLGGVEGAGDSHGIFRELTDPLIVKDYTERTQVDALAISIGNAHGFYKGEPDLQFELLAQIAEETDVPLVLHGGSGINDKDFQKAISLGISKINFYTGLSVTVHNSLSILLKELEGKYQDMTHITWNMMNAYQNAVEERMVVFKSSFRV